MCVRFTCAWACGRAFAHGACVDEELDAFPQFLPRIPLLHPVVHVFGGQVGDAVCGGQEAISSLGLGHLELHSLVDDEDDAVLNYVCSRLSDFLPPTPIFSLSFPYSSSSLPVSRGFSYRGRLPTLAAAARVLITASNLERTSASTFSSPGMCARRIGNMAHSAIQR